LVVIGLRNNQTTELNPTHALQTLRYRYFRHFTFYIPPPGYIRPYVTFASASYGKGKYGIWAGSQVYSPHRSRYEAGRATNRGQLPVIFRNPDLDHCFFLTTKPLVRRPPSFAETMKTVILVGQCKHGDAEHNILSFWSEGGALPPTILVEPLLFQKRKREHPNIMLDNLSCGNKHGSSQWIVLQYRLRTKFWVPL